MNLFHRLILTTLISHLGLCAIRAQVPSLINYQGRLTDANGAALTGSKTLSLQIFDAPTAGNPIYNEAIGPVLLDANGIYRFEFGTAGQSATSTSENVAEANGSQGTFQKILSQADVIPGSVRVTDGTYSWNPATGSTHPDDFSVVYSAGLRRLTVTYLSAFPPAGKIITADYRYSSTGIAGALSSGPEHWMSISVDSVAQSPRTRILTVPFASLAAKANEATALKETPCVIGCNLLMRENVTAVISSVNYNGPLKGDGNSTIRLPITMDSILSSLDSWAGLCILPSDLTSIDRIEVPVTLSATGNTSSMIVEIIKLNQDGSMTGLGSQSVSKETKTVVLQGPFVLGDKSAQYLIRIAASVQGGGTRAIATIHSCRVYGNRR